MAQITAAQVKELRNATNVSMMECKRALVETEGDITAATRLLRERGMAVASKRASKAANEGIIASAATEDGTTWSLVEVNCETDFVARNDSFQGFVKDVAALALTTDSTLDDMLADSLVEKIAEIGENIKVRHSTRFVLSETGTVASYIHLGGKVGVLLELGCEQADTVQQDAFKLLAKDLTLHIAAARPEYLTAEQVPEDVLNDEREIFAKQVEDKPPQIVDKIVAGKLKKFLAEICLIEQGFVKEPKQSIQALLDETGKTLNDTPVIRRFVRYQLGE